MASVNLESLKTSGLEKRIRSSIFSRHYKTIDAYISDNLKKKGDNFFIPTIQTIVERDPELEQELINLYNRKFPMGGTEDIDYEIKLLQASVLDGLVVGINTEKGGDFQIYTANIGAIFGINHESKFNMDKTLELNKKRIVHAVRVDIDYTSEEGFNYKVVSLNKNTNLHIMDLDTFEGRFHLVPYIAIQRSMSFFKEMLDDMRILDVRQDKGELHKARYITCRKDVLARYSDNEEFAKLLKPSYFPLKGFFYAPVLGASSLTSGVTRIDLLDVCNVKNVATVENISKPSGGLESILTESSIMTILSEMYETDLVGYQEIVDKLPNDNEILTGAVYDVDKGVPNPVSIIKYMHGLNKEDKAKVEALIPGLEEAVSRKKTVLNRYQEIDPSTVDYTDIKAMLNEGVYKFLIRKKDCTYSSITLSNCPRVLRELYGEDYFAKYESFGVRLGKLQNCISLKLFDREYPLEVWLNHCGLPVSDEIVSKLKELADNNVVGNALREELLNLFDRKPKTSSRKSTRRNTSNDELILARVCLASMTTSGSLDFYRYLDMSKVVSIYRLG
ncbi:hypothetical protein ACEE21_14890 [Clostridium baratii]